VTNPPNPEHQRLLLLRAVRHAHISSSELWLHYFAIGGDAGEYEVEAYLHGSFTLPPLQRDLLAHAANELIDDRPPPPRAPYSTDASPSDQPDRQARAGGDRTSGDARTSHDAGAATGEGAGSGEAEGTPQRRGGSFAGRGGETQDEENGWAWDEGRHTEGNDLP
jgi:hypothetical protein